jgi:Ferredoxin-like protein
MMDLTSRLALNKYEVGEKSHIEVDYEVCKKCKDKWCTYVCPAGTYEANDEKGIVVHYERCLECGAALVACPLNNIRFFYPKRG